MNDKIKESVILYYLPLHNYYYIPTLFIATPKSIALHTKILPVYLDHVSFAGIMTVASRYWLIMMSAD